MPFNPFKKNKENGGNQQEKKNSKVSMKRKSKGNVLTISVPESATELLQDNTPFIVDDQTVGAAVSISEAIGDLSDKKNSDIGQIVNYINHGTISAVVLEQLLDDDTIIIIPDSGTLSTMRSYDSFKNAEYELCYVNLNEGKIKPCFEEETKIPFSELEDISNGRSSLAKKLGLSDTKPSNSEFDDFDDEEDENYDEFSDNQPFNDTYDEIPFDDNVDDSFDGADYSDNEFPMQEPEPEYDSNPASYSQSEPSYEEEQYEESQSEDPFEETTEETISQTAMRTFMVDDIQIEVSDEPFNMHFNASDLVLFTEKRPTDEGDNIVNHLNESLNNMSKVANAEIKQSRTAHINELRTDYMNALGEYVRTCINSELSTFGDTRSAQERHAIEEHHQMMLNNLENEVSERKANIDREYNEAIVNVRNAAAEAAEHEYRENHQKQYIAQIDAIRNVVEQEIENQYINDITSQNEDRHKLAIQMLDEAMVNILEQLTTRYADMVSEEKVIYQKHMESMLEFMSHQRYNEMNRIRVLHDEHARVDIAEKMSAKHAADVADITAKFNAQKKALEADLQSMRQNLDVAVNRATAEAERTIANLRVENQKLVENADRALAKLETADERAESKYVNEIESLHNQISRWEDESAKLHNGQKTSVLIMLGLAIAAVIAAGAIGFISGQSHQAKQYNDTAIERNYELPTNQNNVIDNSNNSNAENTDNTDVGVINDADKNNTDKNNTDENNADEVDTNDSTKQNKKEDVDDIKTKSGKVEVKENSVNSQKSNESDSDFSDSVD